MADSFVFYKNWIADLDRLDVDMQDKVIAELARYGCGMPLAHEDDVIISTLAKQHFGGIDVVKQRYQDKVERSKTGGRPTSIDHKRIRELKSTGQYTAKEIAEMVGCSESTVNREKLL